MFAPSKQRPRRHQARPPRLSLRVLAQRNENVVPAGVWVESAPAGLQQSLAFASVSQVEEELKEQEWEKAANLKRFQGEVKQRVKEWVRMQRKQQLQKSYEAQLSKTVKQLQNRLASCKTLPQGAGSPQLPGGVWRREFCDESVKDSSSLEPPQRLHTDYQPPLLVWAGVDQEEAKKLRQNEYLSYRRHFMSIEREHVREQQRRRERQKRIAEIKGKKETQHLVEEQRMQEKAEQPEPSPEEGACEALAQLKLEERREMKDTEKKQQNEYRRYIEALRALIRNKMKLYNINLPPLCPCGSDFWDSHPDTCANNCAFYKNHKAYSQAVHSLILSCDAVDRSPSGRLPLRDLALLCAHLGQPL